MLLPIPAIRGVHPIMGLANHGPGQSWARTVATDVPLSGPRFSHRTPSLPDFPVLKLTFDLVFWQVGGNYLCPAITQLSLDGPIAGLVDPVVIRRRMAA